MDKGRFILCRKCGVVHHVTSFDKTPAYSFISGEAKTLPVDDWRAFMDQHAGHSLEPLKALGEGYFPAGTPCDPMAVAYFKVTNGEREFFLRRFRRDIAEPLRFEPMEEGFNRPAPALEIQERELRKELKLRFRCDGQSLSDAKVERFIGLFRAAVSAVDVNGVTATEPSYEDDNISYAPLQPATLNFLLEQCARYFNAAEAQALRRFIEAHRDGADVMTLILRGSTVGAESL
jgi:hypothetical protein